MKHTEILAQNIKARRNKLGLSQRRLETLTGCTTIHQIEAGQTRLTKLDNLRRIAEVLNCELADLFMPVEIQEQNKARTSELCPAI